MSGLLPIPFEQYIPKGFKRDAKVLAFADHVDSVLTEILTETKNLNQMYDPVVTKEVLLDLLGEYIAAGIKNNDSEALKRSKIYNAVATHKKRGTFNDDMKIKIDAIAGGDSQIFRSFEQDDWIITGDGTTPTAYYWAALGSDGIDDGLGISIIGSGFEIEVAGNIYIDVDNAALTADEQESIRLDLLDSVPHYMYTHIGYIGGTGAFIEYYIMGV